MKVSICITYYNQQDFVRQSLDSVLAIDFPCEYEILCHDDGSIDGTQSVLQSYQKEFPNKIKYFVAESRENVKKSINRASMSRLKLLKKATGDFIMFLDGDDYYCEGQFIREALSIFKKNSELVAVAFNYKYLDKGVFKEISQKLKTGYINVKTYIENRYYTPAGAILFKNVINDHRLALLNNINNFDDNAITIYFLQFGKLYYFDRIIYVYRQSSDSLWNFLGECERNILEAMDYKMICDSAPSLINAVSKRQYPSLKYLYKKRKKIPFILNEKTELYLEKVQRNGDYLLKDLLTYRSLGLFQRFLFYFRWFFYKIKARKIS